MAERKVMITFQGMERFMKNMRTHNILCSIAIFLFAFGFVSTAFAGTYTVRNEAELASVLAIPDSNKTIVLKDNVLVQNPYNITLANHDVITFILGAYNFQGNGVLNFNAPAAGTGHADVFIEGSTTAFNDGIRLHGDITLTYKGLYTATANDNLGEIATDNVVVDLTTPHSGWDAFNHNVTIGKAGTAKFNISNGNWGKSKNITIGELAGGKGLFNIWGAGTVWTNSENTVVGNSGGGEMNLYDGAVLHTGNFSAGVNSVGTVNIWGAGTILDIFGTNTGAATNNYGVTTMKVTDRAQVYLNYNDNLDNGSTLRGWANLNLGRGSSTFDNSYFETDRGNLVASATTLTFQNRSLFEGSTYGQIKDSPTTYGPYGPQGNIQLSTLTFQNSAIYSPGFGNKVLWDRNAPLDFSQNGMVELYYLGKNADPFDANGDRYVNAKGYPLAVGRYGQLTMNSSFNLKPDGIAIFDFDVEGDSNHANPLAVTLEHKDYTDVTGAATLDGHIHFRPMTGYYRDDVKIQFMDAGSFAGDPNAQLTQWPQRWFENPVITGGALEMTRHQTPFQSSANTWNQRSVGTALDWIYNQRQSLNVDELMLTQEKDIWFPVLDWFWGMNDEDFRHAMEELSGETKAASMLMPINSPWRFAFDRVNWRNRDNHVYFGQQNIYRPMIGNNDIWVTPYYDYLHVGSDGNANGANTSRVSFMSGYDRALGKYTSLGFLFGYSQPKLDQGVARVIADDYLFGMHFNTRIDDEYELKLWGGYGLQNYDMQRTVGINGGERLTANYNGNTWTGSVQISKPFTRKYGVFRPLAAVDYSYVNQDDTTENGFFPIALQYEKSKMEQLFGRVGLRSDFGWKWFNLTSTISYSYLISGDTMASAVNRFEIGGPSFEVRSADQSRSFVNIGLGSQIYLNRLKSRMFFIQYNGNYARRSNMQNASLGYQMMF